MPASGVRIIRRADHPLSRSNISKNALKVLYRLREAGFQAFLVGGAVRDLLLGRSPKDFDIATDAHPEDVHALFRNSRLIGRRFRLAHVRFGREVVEVATFRAAATELDDESAAALDTEGRILRDNVYGSIEEDVWRRDFTANALYYNIADFSVWDFVGGVEDIRRRKLRLIGDVSRRLREDPVRMLRAIRFAAKLDFSIDPAIEAEFAAHRDFIGNVPPARLFDEFMKLFHSGDGLKTFDLLYTYGLFQTLFPDTAELLQRRATQRLSSFIREALRNTDERIASDQSVTPMFLLGVFMWGPVRDAAGRLRDRERMSDAQALGVAAQQLVVRQQSRLSVPKRFSQPMREMLAMQPRFERRRGKRALSFLEHRRFRAAYDFYVLRSRTGDADAQSAAFWTEVQTLPQPERLRRFGVGAGKKSTAGRRRRSRRRDVVE